MADLQQVVRPDDVLVDIVGGEETESKGTGRGLSPLGTDVELGVGEITAKRTGTKLWDAMVMTTAVMGCCVLSLVWPLAQLGWVAGLAVMLVFSAVTYTTCPLHTLLAADHCSEDSGGGKRRDHHSIWEMVYHYVHSFGLAIELTNFVDALVCAMILWWTSWWSPDDGKTNKTPSTACVVIVFGVVQMFMSQVIVIPPADDHHQMMPIVAAVMFSIYSLIVVALSILQIIGNGGVVQGSLTGIVTLGKAAKLWRVLQGLGDIALAAYGAAAATNSRVVTTDDNGDAAVGGHVLASAATAVFFLLCLFAVLGYAALGDTAPGNLLATHYHTTTTTTTTGSLSSSWLLVVANIAAVLHHGIAYQLILQPQFAAVEELARQRGWSLTVDVNVPIYDVYGGGGSWRTKKCEVKLFRLLFVAAATAVSVLLLPTNSLRRDAAGLLGAVAFWPLTAYFPVEKYVARKGVSITRGSTRWVCLQILRFAAGLVAVAAGVGYVAGIVNHGVVNVAAH